MQMITGVPAPPQALPPWVVGLIVAAALFYALSIARRMRELIRLKVRRMLAGIVLFAIGGLYCRQQAYPQEASLAISFLLALTPLAFIRSPPRSRAIPKSMRQAVIARDLKGQLFDGKHHHVDHIVPFSKGGDHSVVNLRVIPKGRNLKKGARMPTLRDVI